MATGTGFGKTILIGDQFVLKHVPAIVSAIPFKTETRVERLPDGEGWILEDNRIEVPGYKAKKAEQQTESINHILDVMGIDTSLSPLKISIGGDLLAGSGVGASAASCVSLARAINQEFGLNYTTERINYVGWEGEFAYHGIPSGVDNTASTYGGLILYHVDETGQKKFQRIKTSQPFEIVLANSGITANTADLGPFVDNMEQENPDLFWERMGRIKKQVYAMQAALEADDLPTVGTLMTENHQILIEMGLSHPILVTLSNLAQQHGALGAKVTGGGRGGYMIALTPGRDCQEAVASTIEREGYKVIRAVIGGQHE